MMNSVFNYKTFNGKYQLENIFRYSLKLKSLFGEINNEILNEIKKTDYNNLSIKNLEQNDIIILYGKNDEFDIFCKNINTNCLLFY